MVKMPKSQSWSKNKRKSMGEGTKDGKKNKKKYN